MAADIAAILDRFRAGDEETAFYDLLESPGSLLSELIDGFRSDSQSQVRALLVKVAWERKEEGVIAFLSEALTVADELVWQQALDGLVAFPSDEVREILIEARERGFVDEALTNRFRLWLDEALHQVEFELRAKT
jgi:hypothetical protein